LWRRENTITILSNVDKMDSRKVIPVVLKKSSQGWIEN
jgi:hypothetical protein